jgi:hypothetical protein
VPEQLPILCNRAATGDREDLRYEAGRDAYRASIVGIAEGHWLTLSTAQADALGRRLHELSQAAAAASAARRVTVSTRARMSSWLYAISSAWIDSLLVSSHCW